MTVQGMMQQEQPSPSEKQEHLPGPGLAIEVAVERELFVDAGMVDNAERNCENVRSDAIVLL